MTPEQLRAQDHEQERRLDQQRAEVFETIVASSGRRKPRDPLESIALALVYVADCIRVSSDCEFR